MSFAQNSAERGAVSAVASLPSVLKKPKHYDLAQAGSE